jgi:Cd2+/Zn2+-exporting ATPase
LRAQISIRPENTVPKLLLQIVENKNIPVNKVAVGFDHSGETRRNDSIDGKIISGETTVDEAAYWRTHPERQASW